MKKSKEQNKSWVEKFDNEFPNSREIFQDNDTYGSRRKAIKSFISSELSAFTKEMIEAINKEKEGWCAEIVKENIRQAQMEIIKKYNVEI